MGQGKPFAEHKHVQDEVVSAIRTNEANVSQKGIRGEITGGTLVYADMPPDGKFHVAKYAKKAKKHKNKDSIEPPEHLKTLKGEQELREFLTTLSDSEAEFLCKAYGISLKELKANPPKEEEAAPQKK